MPDNLLYYGDNLDVLRSHIKDGTVDLIYLDPPFDANAGQHALFVERDGARASPGARPFEDSWRWNEAAAAAYEETVAAGGKIADALSAFRTLLGPSTLLAYLALLAPRLVELRRVLKPTGSLYLHCEPTASHYLKLLLDVVFGPDNFRNEVVWRRPVVQKAPSPWDRVHDVLLFYVASRAHVWNETYQPFSTEYLDEKYRYQDALGRYRLDNLTGPGNGTSGRAVWRGFLPPPRRRWRYALEKLDELDAAGRIYWAPKGRAGRPGFPQLKLYLKQSGGVPVQDVVSGIPPVTSQSPERLGYPTQKPEALLERIIRASTNEGDTVLDPFCGCGTAVVAAQRLNRHWIGVDVSQLAINLAKQRLRDTFGGAVMYTLVGEPKSVAAAEEFAAANPNEFRWWALGLVGARPVEQEKGAGHGVDGRLTFHDRPDGATRQVVIRVDVGPLPPARVGDLADALAREGADIGVLLTLHDPTAQARAEAAGAGFYHSPGWNKDYPRLQILSVAELLAGTGIAMPPLRPVGGIHRKAARGRPRGEQARLALGD